MRAFILFLLILIFLGAVGLFGYYALRKPAEEISSPATETPLPDIDEPTVTVIDPVRGNPDAAVTIIEFGDYFCAFCQEMEPVVREVLATYPDTVRLVWKDFPNESRHGQAAQASEAGRCAGEQGAFWTYHDLLLRRAGSFTLLSFADLAAEAGLDEAAFTHCLESGRMTPLVTRSIREGQALKITGVPFFFLNGKPFAGSTLSAFALAIDSALTQ